MAQFQLTTAAEPGRTVVHLSGEADLSVRDELTAALLAAVAAAPEVVVDLGGLTFLDSSGLHGLIIAHRAAERDGTRLSVINARGVVAELLDVTGVAALLNPSGNGNHGSHG